MQSGESTKWKKAMNAVTTNEKVVDVMCDVIGSRRCNLNVTGS